MSDVICEQQRRRSACASAQSDQHLCFRCLDSIMSLVSVTKISSLMLAYVAEQASLSLTWSETPEDRFSRAEAQIKSKEQSDQGLQCLPFCLHASFGSLILW